MEGQTCIAPDYILVKKVIKEQLIELLKSEIIKAYSKNPKQSDLPRIINTKNTKRLSELLNNLNVVFGGEVNEADCYISPTLVDEPSLDSELMTNEIFGPILPIVSYETNEDIEAVIWNLEKPLSLYVFSKSKTFVKQILNKFSFGGGVVNDSLIHFGNHRLPFGGIGNSWYGSLSWKTWI